MSTKVQSPYGGWDGQSWISDPSYLGGDDAYWQGIGYQGPTRYFNGEDSVTDTNGLLNFLNSQGWQRVMQPDGTGGGSLNAILDRNGNVVQGSQYNTSYNDDGFWTAALLAGAVTGANVAGAGAGASGAADSGLSGMDLAADAGANSGNNIFNAAQQFGTGAATSGVSSLPSSLPQSPASVPNMTPTGTMSPITLPQVAQTAGTATGLMDLIKAGAPIAGAIAGAADAGPQQTSSERKLDPRMESILYGANGGNGLLGAIGNYFQQNQGINPTMQQGLDMQKAFYTSPQYAQGFNQMRDTGLQMMQGGMAANPFTAGQASLATNPFLKRG